jgi:CheY-like chemotaxis protein
MQPLANTPPLLVLVEDSASVALQFRFHFEALGYEVLTASTGQAGLSLVQQLNMAPPKALRNGSGISASHARASAGALSSEQAELSTAAIAAGIIRPAESPRPFSTQLCPRLPALIVLDYLLPDISGLQVCQQFKKDGKLKHIPILMHSVENKISAISEAYKAGVNYYVVKDATSLASVERLVRLIIPNRLSLLPATSVST